MRMRVGWLAAGIVGMGVLCGAQEEAEVEVASDLHLTLGLAQRSFLFEHSALQRRMDRESSQANLWREGDTSGNGWGLQARLGHATGAANLRFYWSGYDYELTYPTGGGQQISTDRRDLDLYWSEVTETTSRGEWGWNLGIRHIGLNENLTINERGYVGRQNGQINWNCLMGGYFGEGRPLGGRYFRLFGSIHFLLGEASGMARSGTDESNDGRISERYTDQYSLGYGANAAMGIVLTLLKQLDLSIEYQREWLYSFKSTTTGVVVFPDNNDALFISQQHVMTAALAYRF